MKIGCSGRFSRLWERSHCDSAPRDFRALARRQSPLPGDEMRIDLLSLMQPLDSFPRRHLGSDAAEIGEMLATVGVGSMEELVAATVPASIRLRRPLELEPALGERAAIDRLRAMASKNRVLRSFIGMGYHGTVTPPVILRNVLENPGWYTQYTPYQAEISQGRLEALVNFQTMIADLTGLPLSNASLLDEGTAAAEAMVMARSGAGVRSTLFFVADDCHPQTIAVVRTRAEALGIEVRVAPVAELAPERESYFGVLLAYPTTDGRVEDLTSVVARVHAGKALVVVVADILSLAILRPPGEFGADIAVGSTQRFGVPMGFGGPHAAFLATREELRRHVPGRIVGVSRDARGNMAYRLALQTREQHIRRDKATSNICTSQVLLAIMASMYAVYHGAEGLRAIAERVWGMTALLRAGLEAMGVATGPMPAFDTLRAAVPAGGSTAILAASRARGMNLRPYDDGTIGISLDETTTLADVQDLWACFVGPGRAAPTPEAAASSAVPSLPDALRRTSPFLTHPVFSRHRGEHEMLRYLTRLQSRDLSLTTSMIPLGSCTMKLNATTEMIPVTWPEFAHLHPFAPADQAEGYAELVADLERWLSEVTGFTATSLQPNAGSQGEYAGLLVIRAYHRSRGEGRRKVCLIPVSAHGTNPASAAVAGMTVVPVACDSRGNIDPADLERRAEEHAGELAALMVTYPSTHGVFEEQIRRVCDIVHARGGQVYMDGANMNAQVGLCRPGDIGADVCHLNLHKTFAIPHGGGGPGMGPICVASHLAPFLPGHPLRNCGGRSAIGPVSSAPWGSASVLPISWAYIAMMGADGLRRATELAILNANYMAHRLSGAFPLLYAGERGRVAHEFILDLRPFKATAGVEAEDVAKRLMDFGFHAPTMSFPVPGTLMIEPTESESRRELDRFCDAMLSIREEIAAIETGRMSREDNPLKNAPHTAQVVGGTEWAHPYSREQAAWPCVSARESKFWPHVARIDNAWGDRNLFCTCPPMSGQVGLPPSAVAR